MKSRFPIIEGNSSIAIRSAMITAANINAKIIKARTKRIFGPRMHLLCPGAYDHELDDTTNNLLRQKPSKKEEAVLEFTINEEDLMNEAERLLSSIAIPSTQQVMINAQNQQRLNSAKEARIVQ